MRHGPPPDHSDPTYRNFYPVVTSGSTPTVHGLVSPVARLPSFSYHCPPGVQPRPHQWTSNAGCSGITNYSPTTKRRVPEERVPMTAQRPQPSTPSRKPPICRPPQGYSSAASVPSKSTIAHHPTRPEEDDAVIFVSASMPVSPPVSTAASGFVAKKPAKTKLIRPIPIRIIPPPSVFSWSRPEVSLPSPVLSTIAPSRVTPICERTHSPSEAKQIPVQVEASFIQASICGGAASDNNNNIIISEGDIDVGEQVTVETDEPESFRIVGDDKLEEYKKFVSLFRSCRMTHNYTLVDVIQQVSSRYRQKLTLRSMTDFEDLVLEKRKYTHIITILKVWMEDVADKEVTGVDTFQLHGIVPSSYQRRKARTSSKVIYGLENYFSRKRNPTPAEYRRMAKEWKVEESFVRSWFCDRRKKEKKGLDLAESYEMDLDWNEVSLLQKGSVIPSSSHTISIEVSSRASAGVGFQTAPPYHIFI